MSSTFGGVQTALTGLQASQKALSVVGQNITNSSTPGYTRQSAKLQSVGAVGQVSQSGVADNVGSGVNVTGVSRATDALADASLRAASAASAESSGKAATLSSLEGLTSEPTDTGLAGQMDTMWNDWADLSNAGATTSGGTTSAANVRPVVLADTQAVVSAIKSGHDAVDTQWNTTLKQANAAIDTVNSTAKSVADLNAKIKVAVVSGGDANDLMDQRDQLVTTLSTLTGATAQVGDDGVANVYLNGHSLVAGSTAYTLNEIGTTTTSAGANVPTPVAPSMATVPVALSWADGQSPNTAAIVTTGSLGASLNALNSTLPNAAAAYDSIASALATSVNGALAGSYDGTGAPAKPLFTTDGTSSTGPFTASNLTLNTAVSADASGMGLGTTKTAPDTSGNPSADTTVADTISQLGTASTGPNALWKTYVADLGTRSAAATLTASATASTLATATATQQSTAGVSLDEETTNLLTLQRTYQGAAKVMSAIDTMLGNLMDMVN